MDRRLLTRFAWLSIVAAIVTIVLKGAAYGLTRSIGLLSDALESFVNLVVAVIGLAMLAAAARPPDEGHAYGHGKAEYFSSVIEGTLELVVAGTPHLLTPGRVFVIPPDVPHAGRAHTACRVLDTFAPVREEYK